MFLLARLLAAFTKTGFLFLISKAWSKSEANEASEVLIALNLGIIISALDSGKLFYNSYFKNNCDEDSKSEYLLRLCSGLILGCLAVFFVLYKKSFQSQAFVFCFVILINERVFDETQRFLIAKKMFNKWSNLQIIKSILLISISPLALINTNKDAKIIILCCILLMPLLIVTCFILLNHQRSLLRTCQNTCKRFIYILKLTLSKIEPCFVCLAGSSLTIPKNLFLIIFAKEPINDFHILFSICALQSLYIFGFYIIKNRWKILQDKDANSVINTSFIANLFASSFLILVVGFFLYFLNILSIGSLFFLPLIVLIEFLFNLNTTNRDIIFYKSSKQNLLKIDLFLMGFFTIGIITINKAYIYGLLLLVGNEGMRYLLYKNELRK